MKLTRREFLDFAFKFSTAFAILPVFSREAAAGKKLAIPLDKAEKLKTVDGWAILKIQDTKILFVRASEGTVVAFSPVCTHEKCELAYNKDTKRLECPCHHSNFNLNGAVLNGPANGDLMKYKTTLDLEKNRIILEM